MRWDMIGAVALVLVAVFVFGRLWFALVECALGKLKQRFSKRQPPVWHPLSDEEEPHK